MKALILAAGYGSRLGDATDGMPKGFIEIGGKPILDRQIEILEAAGIERVCLATGYRFEEFEKRYGRRVDYRYNPFWDKGNNMVSFLFARDWLDGPFICMYADLLYEPAVMEAVLAAKGDIALAVDRSAIEAGHALVTVEAGSVRQVGTHVPPDKAYARFIGIAKFSAKGARDLLPEVEAAAKAGQLDKYYVVGVQRLMDRGYPVEPADVSGKRWMEIDFPADLDRARRDWT